MNRSWASQKLRLTEIYTYVEAIVKQRDVLSANAPDNILNEPKITVLIYL